MCVLWPVWAATLDKTTEQGSGEELEDHLRSPGLAPGVTSGHKDSQSCSALKSRTVVDTL